MIKWEVEGLELSASERGKLQFNALEAVMYLENLPWTQQNIPLRYRELNRCYIQVYMSDDETQAVVSFGKLPDIFLVSFIMKYDEKEDKWKVLSQYTANRCLADWGYKAALAMQQDIQQNGVQSPEAVSG